MPEAIIMPKTGMAMEEGVIISWKVQEGDVIQKGDIVAEIETDKTAMELESDCAGTVLKLLYQAGSTVPVTAPIAWVGEPGEKIPDTHRQESEKITPETKAPEPQSPAQFAQEGKSSVSGPGKRAATPAARRAAGEQHISLDRITPSGQGGEIRERDVLAAARSATPLAARMAEEQGISIEETAGSGHGGKVFSSDLPGSESIRETRIPLTNIQRITGERMSESIRTIPMVTQHMDLDVTSFMEGRKELNSRRGYKLTINDFVLFAVSRALAEHPRMNSVLEGNEVICRHEVNLGAATATKRGLLVPVLKGAQSMGLLQISQRMKKLAEAARDGTLTADEMSEGTFTVSNVGMFGITSFTPIINPPEAGILGICAVQQLPRFMNNELKQRSIMGISLTFDHRIMDGAEAAEFMQSIQGYLEVPLSAFI